MSQFMGDCFKKRKRTRKVTESRNNTRGVSAVIRIAPVPLLGKPGDALRLGQATKSV